ncbi:hypothetical protein ACFVW2_10275 [Streptomyces sp. NPDC058171]
MTFAKPAREEFGRRLTELRERAEDEGNGGFTACAAAAGVSVETVKRWCGGETAPRRDNSVNAERLVVFLRRVVGEPAEFDETWRQALRAAQWEGEDQRGTAEGRGVRRRMMARYGAEDHTGRALRDRKGELAAMEDFFDTTDEAPTYLWWQAPPRAGASVLLTRFLLEPPENADVVGYFVSRTGERNRSRHFVGAVVRQLMHLLKRKMPRTPEDVPPATLQRYFQAAARRSARSGRRLLVVVDGLDQDLVWHGGASASEAAGPSIAALLPHASPHRPLGDDRPSGKRTLRVIVSSRPAVTPPVDVPSDHPLRGAAVVRALAPSPHARDTAAVARDELARLRATELGRTVVGLLATAGAGLSASDLAELADVERSEVERLLTADAGRCLVPDDLDVGSHALGGAEWVRVAREESGQALLARCAGLLHRWADSWRLRAWPPSAPRYLLSHHPRLLRGDPERVERYVLDPHRHLRMVAEGLADEALAQLDLATDGRDDLGVAARVSLARTVLTQRARPVPGEFPRLFALAGDVDRARALARSSAREAARAVRLAGVAAVLPNRGEAAAVAREAADMAERAFTDVPRVAESDTDLEALAGTVLELHVGGQREFGGAVLRAVLSCEAVGWAYRVRAAKALGGPRDVSWLVGVAKYAESLSVMGPHERAEAMEIWGELAEEVPDSDKVVRALVADFCDLEPVRGHVGLGAAAIRQRIDVYCAGLDAASDVTHVDLLALGAAALVSTRRARAKELALSAERALRAALADPGALSPADRAHLDLELSTTLARVVHALYEVEQTTKAGALPESVPEELRLDVLGEDVREQARTVVRERTDSATTEGANTPEVEEFQAVEDALAVHPLRGRQLLTAAFERWEGRAAPVGTEGWGLPLAHALATTGHAETAARLVGRSGEAAEQAGSLALVSMGCAAGQYRAEAVQYAQEAARAAADLSDPAVRGLVAQAFAHAGLVGPAVQWAGGDGATGRERQQGERARAAVAVGLAAHDPEVAAGIVEEQLAGVGGTARLPGRERHLPRVLGLLLALPDPRRPGARLLAALRALCARADEDVLGWDLHAVLLHALLDAGRGDGGGGLRVDPGLPVLGSRLVRWEEYATRTPLPEGVLPVAEWAVLHAVRGDVPGALATAGRAGSARARAAALAAVATYLAGVTVTVPAADGRTPQHASVLRFLALADALATDRSRDVDEARRLVRRVLAGEHWRYALPLLPRLAPECVPLLGESALGYADGGR